MSSGDQVRGTDFQLLSWFHGFPSAKGARFIMVSNSDPAPTANGLCSLGAVAYFQKPLDHDRLFALVNAENSTIATVCQRRQRPGQLDWIHETKGASAGRCHCG